MSNNFVNQLYDDYKKKDASDIKKPIKLAMISDLHVDYEYTPGNSNHCGKPTCCRSDSGPPEKPE